jgi:Domain of unknown function (DUF1707)
MSELPPRRESSPPAVRVSDADREQTVVRLREHTVAGRLTLEEFSQRVDRALAARTRAELDAATEHLPQPKAPPGRARGLLITLFGSEQRRGRWLVPERIWAVSLVGAPDLDFRQAAIASSEVQVTSFSIVGALTALVPAGVDVELGGLALVGGNDLTGDAPATAGEGPTIRIRSYALIGGARVTLVRASSTPELT